MPVNNFSVRYAGQLEALATGNHDLRIIAEGGVRMYVDGQLRVDRWSASSVDQTVGVDLISGRRYDVQLEFRETGGDASVSLRWTPPTPAGQAAAAESIIPVERLFPAHRGGITQDRFDGITGSAVSDLTLHPSFPDSPTSSTLLSTFEVGGDIGNNFGDRLAGQLHAPETGVYRFYLSADQAARLRLSTDDGDANLQTIAEVNSPTGPRQWDADPSQVSADVHLVAGHSYAIEVLRKEASGTDHVAVGWRTPTDLRDGTGPSVIDGGHLSPVTPEVRLFVQKPNVTESNSIPGVFTVTRTGPTTDALTVPITTRGDAVVGVDVAGVPTAVTIPAGQSSVDVQMSALSDSIVEPTESLVVELQSGVGYELGPISSRTGRLEIQDSSPPPAGGTSVIVGETLSDFDFYGASFNNRADARFGSAIRATITNNPSQIYNVQLTESYNTSVAKDDILLVDFWVRSIGSQPGTVTVTAESEGPPYDKSFFRAVSAPTEWTRVQIPFTSHRDYAAGEAAIKMQLGHGNQTIEFADVHLLNYGRPGLMINQVDSLDDMFAQTLSGNFGNWSTVPASGVPSTVALRAETTAVPNNAWQFQYVGFNQAELQTGETARLTFYARNVGSTQARIETLVSEPNNGYATATYVGNQYPSSQWTQYVHDFTATKDYAIGDLQLSYNLGHRLQEVEIAAVRFENLDRPITLDALPLSIVPVTYGGRESDAAWRDRAATDIDAVRQTDLTVNVVDADGNAVPGAAVYVDQTEHEFKFGTAVATLSGLTAQPASDATAARYQEELLRLFNTATIENAVKWGQYAAHAPKGIAASDWLQSNDFYVRGHNGIWPSRQYMPDSVWNQYDTLAATDPAGAAQYLRDTIEDRFDEVAAITDVNGYIRFDDWDVLNEPFTNRAVMDVLGDAYVTEIFQRFGQLLPNTPRILNDFSIFSDNGGNTAHVNDFKSWLTTLNNAGAIEAIGEQSHYSDSNLTDIDSLAAQLDDFSTQFNLPIYITEFDFDTVNRQLQADYMRDYLTMSYSHPNVEQFVQWGFWEGAHWLPESALFDRGFNLRPHGQAYEDLVYGDWWTDARGTTASSGASVGQWSGRVTKGDYEVTVVVGGQTYTQTVDALTDPRTVTVQVAAADAAPTVTGVVVGDGSAQRSIIRQVEVNFDQDVAVDADAFEVVRKSDGNRIPVDVTATVNGSAVTLTFAGGSTTSGRLIDGEYELRVRSTAVRSAASGLAMDGDDDGSAGGDHVFGAQAADDFFALAGDVTGNGSVQFNDALAIINAYNSVAGDANYNAAMDFDGDGDIQFNDFLVFSGNYNASR